MTLREKMARHAAILTRLDHFGEEAQFTPAGGAERTVRVVVDRLASMPVAQGSARIARSKARVAIPANDAVGTATSPIGGKIQLVMRLGAEAVWAHVRQVLEQDEGFWLVEVEA